MSSLVSLFICSDKILNVVTKFFCHLPYSFSQQSYQVSRHSSCLPSLVLLQYSFPCCDNTSAFNFPYVVTFISVLRHFSCTSSHIMLRQSCEMSRQSFNCSLGNSSNSLSLQSFWVSRHIYVDSLDLFFGHKSEMS